MRNRQEAHGNRDGPARPHCGDELRRVERAEKRARAPSRIQPAVADGAGVKYVVTERRSDHDSGHHRAQKKRPADSQCDHRAVAAKKIEAFAHLADKARHRGFRGDQIGPQFRRPRHHVASLAHSEIEQKRCQVGREINQQHAAQSDVVVDESDDRSGNQPAALYSRQQKSVGVNEFFSGSQFLDQRRDGRPEHPEARRHQSIHHIKLPDFYFAGESQDRDHKNDDGAGRIQPHHQPAPVFAIDENSGEGQHQHGRQGLQHRKRSQRDFRVRGLQDVPGNGGRIHAAAQHRDHVGAENVAQRFFLQDRTHALNVNDGERLANGMGLSWGVQVSLRALRCPSRTLR